MYLLVYRQLPMAELIITNLVSRYDIATATISKMLISYKAYLALHRKLLMTRYIIASSL
jgi:hypothetical protein